MLSLPFDIVLNVPYKHYSLKYLTNMPWIRNSVLFTEYSKSLISWQKISSTGQDFWLADRDMNLIYSLNLPCISALVSSFQTSSGDYNYWLEKSFRNSLLAAVLSTYSSFKSRVIMNCTKSFSRILVVNSFLMHSLKFFMMLFSVSLVARDRKCYCSSGRHFVNLSTKVTINLRDRVQSLRIALRIVDLL